MTNKALTYIFSMRILQQVMCLIKGGESVSTMPWKHPNYANYPFNLRSNTVDKLETLTKFLILGNNRGDTQTQLNIIHLSTIRQVMQISDNYFELNFFIFSDYNPRSLKERRQ